MVTAKRQKVADADALPRVTAECAADLLGLSVVSFSTLVKDGFIERQGAAGYDVRSVCRAAIGEYRRRAHGRGEYSDQRELSAARAKEAKARARHIELRSADLEGKNWPIERVHFLFANTLYVVVENLSGLAGSSLQPVRRD
jgi:hypothetical protein